MESYLLCLGRVFDKLVSRAGLAPWPLTLRGGTGRPLRFHSQ